MTKEEFNSVWKDTTREDILNQFYYEHMEIQQLKEQLPYKYITDDEFIKECECKYLRSEEKNKLYKSVLDEIREYITEDLEEPDPEVYQEYTVDISWFTDLLQILDKAKND